MDKNVPKIFVYWDQGEENAPILVKRCISSVRKNSNGHEVIVLNKDNLFDWIRPFSKEIENKFYNNVFSIQLKSDLIRLSILAQYPGLWMDSTVFVSKPIPLDVFNEPFFTVVRKEAEASDITGKISPFLLGRNNNKSGKRLFSFAKEMLINYIKSENDLINYLLIENILTIGLSKDDNLKSCLNHYYQNKKDILGLVRCLNYPANNYLVKKILAENVFNKLNYHKSFKLKTENGEKTVYYKLINGDL